MTINPKLTNYKEFMNDLTEITKKHGIVIEQQWHRDEMAWLTPLDKNEILGKYQFITDNSEGYETVFCWSVE